MKPKQPSPMHGLKTVFLFICSIPAILSANAQATLEFANGSGPAGNGSSITNQVITFQENTNNPTGNTFVPYSLLTATFSLSNQQYFLPAAWMPSSAGVVFGATISTTSEAATVFSLFPAMNAVGAAASSDFTSAGTITPGAGIAIGSNYGVEIFNSAMGLFTKAAATNGRYYTAELTISFSSAVTNPVLHLVGMGATVGLGGAGVLGITSEMDLQTTGVTLSELSGSAELSVNATQILNSALHPSGTTGSGAASGSVLVTGTGITSLVFKIYLRGDGNLTAWSNTTQHTGDGFMIGISTLMTNIILPVTLVDFTAVAQPNHTTQLQWATAMEQNTAYFEVEQSADQAAWTPIGAVPAAGNSNTRQNYSFADPNPLSGNNYYRLKEVGENGNAVYSQICMVPFNIVSQLSFYPNPVKDQVTIITSGASRGSVTVLTAGGRQLQQVQHFNSGQTIDMSRYPAGIYLLAVKKATGTTEVLKVLKN
jgi:hypothetical protein